MNDETDLLVELLAKAETPENFTKPELGAMLKAAADRIKHDAEMMARIQSEIQLVMKSIDNAQARVNLAKTEAKGRVSPSEQT